MKTGMFLYVLSGIVGGLFANSAMGQFESATVNVHVEAQSFLDTLFGSGTRNEFGGSGAFPLFLGTINANQTIGSSSDFASAQVGLEMSATGLSGSGSMHANIESADDIVAANCSALSRLSVTFTIDTQTIWTIPSGHATSTNANASIRLLRGATTLFDYSGDITNVQGVIEAGTYQLFIEASGSSEYSTSELAADASYSLEFQLAAIEYCTADLNGDKAVDDADFVIFVAAYDILDCADPAMPPGCDSDLNGDLFVDDADFSIFVVAYDALLCP